MHTIKRAAIVATMAGAAIAGTAGISHADHIDDQPSDFQHSDSKRDTADCEFWVVYSAIETSEDNVFHREGGKAEAQADAPEICHYFGPQHNGFDVTDITWGEYVDIVRAVSG